MRGHVMTEERMLTLEDIADRLRLPFNERALKRMIRKHKIAYIKIGRAWRLTEKQFTELMAALTHSPPATYSPPVSRSVVKVTRRSREALLEEVKKQLQRPARTAAGGKSSRTRSPRKAEPR
jgi:hypothetical protein